jgi:cell division protease FtsH
MFDDFGGRIPSDKPPIKTPGELAIERGEPWPQPVAEPAFKAAIAQATQAAEAAQAAASEADRSGGGANGSHAGGRAPTQPDYGAPAGWHAPGWPPHSSQRPSNRSEPRYSGQPYPDAEESPEQQDKDVSRSNPPAHG